jgi:phage FluMu gp28-like protein
MVKFVQSIEELKQEYIDAFKLEYDEQDIKHNKEAKIIAKDINKRIRDLNKCIKILKEYIF